MILAAVCCFALLAWLGVLLRPSQPHRTIERLEAGSETACDLGDVTALIPARNEAAVIERTLRALVRQGSGLQVLVIDDQSTDSTAAICARLAAEWPAIRVIRGRPLPPGWGGKLWALQQGLEQVERPYTLLLDADIELAHGMLASLIGQARRTGAGLVSIMAQLRCEHFWERLLVPPFIFFFKLLYPFASVNSGSRRTAAAAGGCMLLDTRQLRVIGGFASIRDALIDDCALAGKLKGAGAPIWLGLSHSVTSHRSYAALADFWRMVSRTAYTQLNYSLAWLVAVSVLMLALFAAPVLALLVFPSAATAVIGGAALLGMAAAYVPVVRFYALPVLWVFTLPPAALLFLAMTWASAVNYWRGTRAIWKDRAYVVPE